MSLRSERLQVPWSPVEHVAVLLSPSEERQHQLNALLVAPDDRGTSESHNNNNNDEPLGSWLQSGKSTIHGNLSYAIDDLDSDRDSDSDLNPVSVPVPILPPSACLFRTPGDTNGLPCCNDNDYATCDFCGFCGARTWTWKRGLPPCGGALTRAPSCESLGINRGHRERKPPARRKTMHIWECCQCGKGNINIQIVDCPDCGVSRCVNCKTTRIQVRGHLALGI